MKDRGVAFIARGRWRIARLAILFGASGAAALLWLGEPAIGILGLLFLGAVYCLFDYFVFRSAIPRREDVPAYRSGGGSTDGGQPGSDSNTLWHTLPVSDVLARLRTTAAGLSEAEAARRLLEYGPNELRAAQRVSPWAILLEQFKNVLVLILLVAVGLSAVLGHGVEALVIAIIVLFAVLLGFVQEYRAERAIEALRQLAAPRATVLRDGDDREIPARELVPGDVILLRAGDKIPADARLIEAVNLQVEEAALTGESVPVEKHTAPLRNDYLTVGDRKNMVYAGTAATYGRGRAVVIATGMQTEFGRIAQLLQTIETGKTPLQENLDRVGHALARAALVVVLVIVALGLFRGQPLLEMLIFGIALAVGASRRLQASFPGWDVGVEACADSPAWAVVKRAAEWRADLVVVGSRGQAARDRFLLGRVSHTVVIEASCSVRVARSPIRGTAGPARIIIGLDRSDGARSALREMAARCWPAGSQARVVAVVDPRMRRRGVSHSAAGIRSTAECGDDERAWAHATAEAAETLEAAGLVTSTHITRGDPKRVLIDEAAHWGADCIFVGARGFSPLDRVLLGSVATAVALRAPCTVEVVRPRRMTGERSPHPLM